MSGLMLEVEPFLEFLRAQLDDDEAVARAVPEPPDWRQGDESDPWAGWDREMVYTWPPEFHTPYEQDKHWRGFQAPHQETAAHIVRNDPARALRLIEGIRQIIHKAVQYEQDGASPCGNVFGYHATGLFTALRHIAEARYADRPGYRDRWRP